MYNVAVVGATGMVGIRLTVKAVDGATQTITDDARNLVPVVAFTIPSRVGSDVVSDDGVTVISGNSSTLIAAIGEPGEELTFTTYVDARHFTMSSLAVAAVQAEDDDDFAGQAGDRWYLVIFCRRRFSDFLPGHYFIKDSVDKTQAIGITHFAKLAF